MFNEFLEKIDAPSSANEMMDPLFELVTDEDRKKYVCTSPGCGKFFRYKSEIIRHTATHSESRPFICQYESCLKAFKRNDALENHIRSTHTKETPFTCPVQECALKFTTHGSFRYHVLKHNKQIPDEELFALQKEESISFPALPTKQIKIGELADNIASLGYPTHLDAAYQKCNKDNEDAEFYTPPPKFAGKIKWEMVSDETECSNEAQKKEDVPYEQYTSVVEENKELKEKLSTSSKIIQTMQKQINELLSNLFICQSRLGNIPNQIHLAGFSQPQETFQQANYPVQSNFSIQQGNFPGNKIKSEEPLQFRGTGYGNNSLPKEGHFNPENTSIDRFLSFGKESHPHHF